MGFCFLVSLVALGRPLTGGSLAAVLSVAASACVSAAVAMVSARLLQMRPWTARYACSLLMLIGGTGALSALLVAIEMAWRYGHLAHAAPHVILLILANLGIVALYYFLSIAAPLILPVGLPLFAGMAALIARRRR
jgi:hypothetical protein